MKKEKLNLCEKNCINEFASCMQMALDTFSMGACYDAEKICEKKCSLQPKKKKSIFCYLNLCKKNYNKR